MAEAAQRARCARWFSGPRTPFKKSRQRILIAETLMTAEYQKPLPNPLHWAASKPFWDAARRHDLVMPRCKFCDKLFFYPREVCPRCLKSDIDWVKVSGMGRLHTFTVIHQPANPAFQ